LFFIGFSTIISNKSFAQNNIFLPVTKLEIKDGLTGIMARRVIKDNFGFMWFATQDGISRFDGRSFINLNSYSADDNKKLLGIDFFDLKNDITGKYLWALSTYGGINKIDPVTCNVLERYNIHRSPGGDTTHWFKCFTETPKYLVIGTNEGVVTLFNKKTGKTDSFFSLAERLNSKNGELERIIVDNKSHFWFLFSGCGILVTDSLFKQLGFIPSLKKDTSATFTNYAFYKQYLFVTSTNGLKIINTQTFLPVSLSSMPFGNTGYFAGTQLHCISIKDSIAVITGFHQFTKVNLITGECNPILLADDYENRSWLTLTNDIYFDDQNIWIGSQYGVGLIKNIHSPFVPYYTSFNETNIKIAHAVTIYRVCDTLLYVCGDDGLYAVNPYTAIIKKFPVADFYYTVFPVKNGYFIGSAVNKGMQLFNKDFKPIDILSVFPELSDISSKSFMAAARLGDSVMFMASENKGGVYIWNTVSHNIIAISTKSGRVSLKNDDVNRLYVDKQDRLWIVCDNAVSIYNYFDNTIKHLSLYNSAKKLPLTINMDVCESNNQYWLASYGTGIVKLSKDLAIQKIYDVTNGLKNLGLYKIFNINDSLIITSSNNGLAVLNKNTGFIKTFTVEDGLHSNSFEEASGEMYSNFVYLGGINGFTQIDITKLKSNPIPPQVTFSTITTQSQDSKKDTLNINIARLPIPEYVTQVIVNFSAINFSAPDKVKIAYRIAEKEKNWSYTTQTFIQSFRLDPGTYTLQVKAANEDGVWSPVKELQLVFLPKWYQTWLFKLAIIAVVAGLLYALYRYRVKQILKVERIRQKLSGDLHDDIGSTLNSVNLFTKMAMMQQNQGEYLPRIKEGVQNAITSVRDIIWIMDKEPETIHSIFSRINAFSQPLSAVAGSALQTNIDPAIISYKLHGQEKQNVYLVIKEAINNCIKYAGCKNITLRTKKINKQIMVSIADDGKGIDKEDGAVKITTGGSGNGLKNMQRRCEEIKWKFTLDSEPGKGTCITITGKIKE